MFNMLIELINLNLLCMNINSTSCCIHLIFFCYQEIGKSRLYLDHRKMIKKNNQSATRIDHVPYDKLETLKNHA